MIWILERKIDAYLYLIVFLLTIKEVLMKIYTIINLDILKEEQNKSNKKRIKIKFKNYN